VHLGPITGIVTDGDHIYSVSQAGIFRAARRLAKPPFRVMSMASAPKKNAEPLLLLGGGQPAASGEIAAIDPAKGTLTRRKLGDDLVYSVAVSPDGKTAAAAMADGRVLTFGFPSLATGSVTEANRHQAVVRAIAFSPDGQWLASAGLDGLVLLTPRNPKAKPVVLADHSAGVESLAFAPNSGQLASGSRDGRVRLHTIGGRLLRTFQGVGEPPDATGFGQAPRVLCLDWSEAGLIGGTSTGYVFRLPNGQGDWQPLHREKASPVYALGQVSGQIVAGKTGQLLKLPKP
jgi:WD40 repeat protein